MKLEPRAWNRRHQFQGLIAAVASMIGIASSSAQEAIPANEGIRDASANITWYDAQLLQVEGQGWEQTASPYDRLPSKAEGVVRQAVWNLSRHSAGISVRFSTSSPSIHAQWALTSPSLAMPHMPATGVSGLDLYVKDDRRKWRWLAVGKPSEIENSVALIEGLPAGHREFLIYLPLYNGVKQLSIGIHSDHQMSRGDARPPETRQPMLFWGTSITQGGCASRPGMVHTAILQRRLHREVINLGFSGNGKMDPELAEIIAEVDAAVYIIDCLPNMEADLVRQRTIPLVDIIRRTRPTHPILLVEDRSYTNSFLIPSKQERNASSRRELLKAYKSLIARGDRHVYYLEGDQLLGSDGEATVDSSHPTDLGFMRMADSFEKKLLEILGPSNQPTLNVR